MFIKNGHLFWCPVFVEPCHCKTTGYAAATALALFTACIEIWGGWNSFSLMLLADGWHVSSDVAVYAVAIWGNVMATRHIAGIQEVKNRWAVRNANVLIAVAFVTMALAVKRMFYPEEVLSDQMLFVASVGLAVNGIMYFVLKSFRIEHEHHDGEDKGHECRNEENHDHLHDTAIWHTASDLALSFVVVSVGWFMWKFPALAAYGWIDPLASTVICATLIFIAKKMKREIRRQGQT